MYSKVRGRRRARSVLMMDLLRRPGNWSSIFEEKNSQSKDKNSRILIFFKKITHKGTCYQWSSEA